MASNPIVSHQQYQPMPKLDAPFVEQDTGIIKSTWYRLLLMIWRRVGGQAPSIQTQNFVILQAPNAPAGPILALLASSGQSMGSVSAGGTTGGAVEQQSTLQNPLVFVAPNSGVLVAATGTMSLSRDGGLTYYPIGSGSGGGVVSVMFGDQVQIAWTGSNQITFFPTS